VESFQVLLLNVRKKLIRAEEISHGLLDTILVHPREVFRAAIVANAAGIVLVHNHPSGDPTPSEADIKVTRDLIRAGQLLKIEVVDHVIIGRATAERAKDYASLKRAGLFKIYEQNPVIKMFREPGSRGSRAARHPLRPIHPRQAESKAFEAELAAHTGTANASSAVRGR
jgi:proteasome lid subunit RPN8/RPN11